MYNRQIFNTPKELEIFAGFVYYFPAKFIESNAKYMNTSIHHNPNKYKPSRPSDMLNIEILIYFPSKFITHNYFCELTF
jgi:hypothetical protein